MERFRKGDPIVLRDLRDGRVWSGRPMTAVKDEPDETMLFAWPDVAHAFLGFWEHTTDRFAGWYVNLRRRCGAPSSSSTPSTTSWMS